MGAPCQSACPIDTEPWRYIAHLENGEYEKAYLAIRETNPLPSVCARVCDHRCETRCKMSSTGDPPIAIRALKRVITDRINPLFYQPDYKPLKSIKTDNNDLETPNIAIVGSGPAGLTAAHYLSVNGYQVTVFEAENEPGGMLLSGIPAYRLPRNVLRLEISSLLDENITLKCNTRLGKDITVDGLLKEGYRAVFLALGAHKSRKLNIEGENMEGVLPSMKFLKAFNRHGQALAKGDVVVIGGGNSAVDAARTAIRQPEVKSVTILYRRTRQEMPAYHEEIEAALEEGIKLEPLVSPIKIHSKDGQLSQMECIRNSLGEIDSSGRRSPKPQSGTEYRLSLDTLIVAISEEPEVDYLPADNIELSKWQTVVIDDKTFSTNRPGVFAGGDVVRGPSTVVDAIADGKKVAAIIDRYLNQEDLIQPAQLAVPKIYVEPPESTSDDTDEAERVQAILSPAESRQGNFREVEKSLAIEDATKEARRCLRCDLEFTKCNQ